MVVVTVVIVSVIRRAYVFHLVDVAALGAALDGAVLGNLSASQHAIVSSISPDLVKQAYRQPNDTVRVGRVARATSILLIAGRSHQDGLFECALAAGIQRPHVEDVDALHLSENLETLNTGGLLEIGGDGTGGGTRTAEVIYGLDVYVLTMSVVGVVAIVSYRAAVGV